MTNKIQSMTGFGKGTAEIGDKKITVEIRTLNSKQLDLNLKMPSSYRESEVLVRQLLAKGLVRGKADVYVSVEYTGGKKSLPINTDVVNDYYRQMKTLDINLTGADYLQAIMRLPEVLMTEKMEVLEGEPEALLAAVTMAVEALNEFRIQEGQVMIKDILARIDNIERFKDELLSYEPERTETVRQRINDSIEKLKINIDQNRFEQEMIFYLEKLDITEEKVRLQNHLDYFRTVCATEEAVGRKLGFITQEIGREINTTGSKSNHAAMQQLVVRMKDELEKIKEQSLNIL